MKHKRDERFQIRKTHDLEVMVGDLMAKRKYTTFAELFRALVREAWEKWCRD